ncbi:hypothetical protein pb186bvf_016175 [Paramecium bursaria]
MNNNQAQPLNSQSDNQGLDKESNSPSQDIESRSETQQQMNQCQTQQTINEHQHKVDQIVTKINQVLYFCPFNIGEAYLLLVQLWDLLLLKESASINKQFLQTSILYFRDRMIQTLCVLKDVQLQLLIHYADTIMRCINNNHKFIQQPEEIMIGLALQGVPLCMARDFLVENFRNNYLWCEAVAKQGIQLAQDLQMVSLMHQLLDKPYAYMVWAEQKYLPFYPPICYKAWELKMEPVVSSFILQQIKKGSHYYRAFLSFGIYEAFKVFINEALIVDCIKIQMGRIYTILKRLLKVWAEEQLFNDTHSIFQSGIMDYISNIPIELFKADTLFQIFSLVCRIDNNSKYDLNFIILNFTWYQRLNKVLLYQKVNGIFSQNTIIRLEQLCTGCLSLEASKAISAVIQEYKNQMLLIN